VLTRPTRATTQGNRRAVLRTLAALGVVAPAAWLGWQHAPWQGWTADYAAATGERRDVTLADGSRLTLNTDTAVDVVFSGTQRLVRLRRGEVYVRTAPDTATDITTGTAPDTGSAGTPRRPFVVETPQGRLRALGTRFTVRLLAGQGDDPPATELVVLEHRVQVAPSGGSAPAIVQAGQGVRFTAAQIGPMRPQAQDPSGVDGAPGWTQGVLYADSLRLDAFLAELSRYRPGVIRCAPEVAGLRISGAFQLADTDYVLAMLRETLPVQVVLRTRWWVTVAPADRM